MHATSPEPSHTEPTRTRRQGIDSRITWLPGRWSSHVKRSRLCRRYSIGGFILSAAATPGQRVVDARGHEFV